MAPLRAAPLLLLLVLLVLLESQLPNASVIRATHSSEQLAAHSPLAVSVARSIPSSSSFARSSQVAGSPSEHEFPHSPQTDSIVSASTSLASTAFAVSGWK